MSEERGRGVWPARPQGCSLQAVEYRYSLQLARSNWVASAVALSRQPREPPLIAYLVRRTQPPDHWQPPIAQCADPPCHLPLAASARAIKQAARHGLHPSADAQAPCLQRPRPPFAAGVLAFARRMARARSRSWWHAMKERKRVWQWGRQCGQAGPAVRPRRLGLAGAAHSSRRAIGALLLRQPRMASQLFHITMAAGRAAERPTL